MASKFLLLASLLFSSLHSCSATQTYRNTGLEAQCDSLSIDANSAGTVDDATNVVYEGTTAIKVTQTYLGTGYTGRYHAECVVNNGYARGETKFYGFAFRLSETWDFTGTQSYNIAQFIADFSDYGCDDYIPSSMIWLQGNQLYSRVKVGPVCSAVTTTFPSLATVSAGVWHRIVIQASWQSDTSGYYKLWLDGVKILEEYGILTTMADSREFSFRVGLYANAWHDQNTITGSQTFRQVWVDEIGIGSTFADADPAQWS